jgi:hypothetical protein
MADGVERYKYDDGLKRLNTGTLDPLIVTVALADR